MVNYHGTPVLMFALALKNIPIKPFFPVFILKKKFNIDFMALSLVMVTKIQAIEINDEYFKLIFSDPKHVVTMIEAYKTQLIKKPITT